MIPWDEAQLRSAFEQAIELIKLRNDEVACVQKEEGTIVIAVGNAGPEITLLMHKWMDRQDKQRTVKHEKTNK